MYVPYLYFEIIEHLRNRVLKGGISFERLGVSLERIAAYKKQFLYPRKSITLKQ